MVKRIAEIVGWLGTALVLVAVAIRFLRPVWESYAYWFAIAGLACMLAYVLAHWRDVVGVFAHRQARLGALAVASVLIVLGILAAINWIGAREDKRWDLTSNKQFTLSDQSRKVLERLDAPLTMRVFDKTGEFDRFRDRLREYEYVTRKVSVDYVDPDKKPDLARQAQVQSYGTVVLDYKGRTERAVGDSEQDITNAIIKVVTGAQKKVYFVQGHGEKDPTSAERVGYNTVAQALGHDNYTTDKLVLAQQGDVPADASVVVIAGPKTDLFPQEVEALRRYLARGGKLFVLIDPPEKADAPPFSNLLGLVHDWGFDVGRNVVVDVSGMGQLLGTDASVPVVANYPSHPITEKFNYLTAFPLARSVAPVTGGVNGHTPQSVIETSARSWAETDIQGLLTTGKVAFNADQGDKQGPITIGAAVTAPAAQPPAPAGKADKDAKKDETRVAVYGDSDFAANFAVNIQGNRDLFLNTVSWLAQQENLIAIRPKEPDDRRLTMTSIQQRNIGWLALLVIPGVIFASGIYTWWRRRS